MAYIVFWLFVGQEAIEVRPVVRKSMPGPIATFASLSTSWPFTHVPQKIRSCNCSPHLGEGLPEWLGG